VRQKKWRYRDGGDASEIGEVRRQETGDKKILQTRMRREIRDMNWEKRGGRMVMDEE
jgi:hypothetical protein